MKLRIFVTLKPGVLDPQGRAIHHARGSLGFAGVEDVRAGKMFELEVADTTTDEAIDGMCRSFVVAGRYQSINRHIKAAKATRC